jgi:hypothetical protein
MRASGRGESTSLGLAFSSSVRAPPQSIRSREGREGERERERERERESERENVTEGEIEREGGRIRKERSVRVGKGG